MLLIGFYFLLLILNYFLSRLLLQYRKLWLLIFVSFLSGIILTSLAVFKLNEPSYFQKEQIELLKSKKHTNEKYVSEGYNFIKDRFIIVDNSYDKQLVERPDILGDNSNTAITDRNKLIQFFRFVNQNIQHIDLVICDIGFDDQTKADTILKQEMDKVYFKKKLLVSNDEENNNAHILKFDPLIQGNIRKVANESRFVSHTILSGNSLSLAYKMYAFENKIQAANSFMGGSLLEEIDSNNSNRYVLNSFIPSFSLTDESFLIGEEPDSSSIAYNQKEKVTNSYNWITLGTAATDDGKDDLLKNLKQRKNSGQKNYLFLGAFKNPEEDIHNTIHKPMHGVTILLNIFYDLTKGINRVSAGSVLLLFLGFTLITLIIISLSLKYPVEKFSLFIKKIKNGKNEIQAKTKKPSSFRFILLPLKFIFFEKLHYLLLLLMFLFVARYTGLIFNIMYFAVYFFFFELSMKYFVKNTEAKN